MFRIHLQKITATLIVFIVVFCNLNPAFCEVDSLASLNLTILDAVTGIPTPCDVQITDAQGKIIIESEAYLSGFRSTGIVNKYLVPGKTKIRVTRGFETQSQEKIVDLAADEITDVTFVLERNVNLRKRGWYAGDSHAHMIHGERTIQTGIEEVALAVQAEDLHYFSLSHDWLMDNPTPEKLDNVLEALSTPDCHLYWNVEAPKNYYKGNAGACLGHGWYIGAKGRTKKGKNLIQLLLEASAGDYQSSKPTFANFEIQQLLHEQGATCYYTHPARWWRGTWGGKGGYPVKENMRISNMAVELPLDTILGPTYEGLDVMMTTNEAATNAKGFKLWSLLLNHGYQIAATASSDSCFDRRNGAQPGAVRTYTYLKKPFSLQAISKATAEGQTFITSGPLLLASVNYQPPGTTFSNATNSPLLKIEAWPSGCDPQGLSRLELIRNGEIIQTFDLKHSTYWEKSIVLKDHSNAWYCVRLYGSDEKHQQAMSGAFYFKDKNFQKPESAPAVIHARITDAKTGKLLPGKLTEVEYAGPLPKDMTDHPVLSGDAVLTIPGTHRLRAEVPGYQSLTLSPIYDYAPIVKTITEMDDQDLVSWDTFEKLRGELGEIELTFSLESN